MAYLHNERVEFADAVNLASERYGVLPVAAEKDYYVTMILRLLAEELPFVVFKGDYEDITSKLLEEPIPYEAAAEAIKQIAVSGVFNFN